MGPGGRLWRTLRSDADAHWDAVVEIDASRCVRRSLGHVPGDGAVDRGPRARSRRERDDVKRGAMERALTYMALEPNKAIADIRIDKVFIGSCTNSRIEDLREAAASCAASAAHREQRAARDGGAGFRAGQGAGRARGARRIFRGAGFEWREPGCSMCLAMNADRLEPGERCASTSNRNFEGRQGAGGRTHLVSPAMAAAAALHGHFVDARRFV
jgi:3-isopropylmalate/(R)-2-methylmalate dehydratase large subunit